MSIFSNTCKKFVFGSTSLLRPAILTTQVVPGRKASKKYQSKQWPDYYVTYNLETIKTITILSRMKLHTTVIAGIAIPAVAATEVMAHLSFDFIHNTTIIFGAIALFFHSLGYFCNNVVGIVYTKENATDVKISYVGYFGKRHNIDTTFDQIYSPKPNKSFFKDPIFSPLIIATKDDKERKLKIYRGGKIINHEQFNRVMGTSF